MLDTLLCASPKEKHVNVDAKASWSVGSSAFAFSWALHLHLQHHNQCHLGPHISVFELCVCVCVFVCVVSSVKFCRCEWAFLQHAESPVLDPIRGGGGWHDLMLKVQDGMC